MSLRILDRAFHVFTLCFIVTVARPKTIKVRPLEAKKLVITLLHADCFIRENKQGAVDVLVDWGKVDREQALASYDSTVKVFNADGNIPQEGLKLVIDQAKTELKLTKDVPLTEIVELAPLREAQRELGIK